jgi:hypothetical protein
MRTAKDLLPLARDLASPRPVAVPRTVDCLRCQLVGRRRLLCAKVDECKSVPHAFFMGPLLLAAWLGTVIAFYVAVR